MRRSSVRGNAAVWSIVVSAAVAVAAVLALGEGQQAQEQRAGAAAAEAYRYVPDDGAGLVRALPRRALPAEAGLVPHDGNRAGDRHVVAVSRAAAEAAAHPGGELPMQLPSGERFRIRFDRSERGTGANWTFVGKVQTRLGPQSAVLTFGPGGVFGVVPLPSGEQMQLSTTRGVTVLEPSRPIHPRTPGGGFADDRVPVRPPGPRAAEARPAAKHGEVPVAPLHPPRAVVEARGLVAAAPIGDATPAQATTATPIEIEVLVFYTKNMVELRGSEATATTEIDNYFAVANQAHVDSGSPVRLRIASSRKIDYPADALNATAFNHLSGNALPDGTDVRSLRESTRADLVAMFRPYVQGDTNGGLGSMPGGLMGLDAAYDGAAYSVNNLSTYTFAHESGHNLGSSHDLETATTNGVVSYGAFPYSFGYRQAGPPGFATIMAYAASGQPWVGYFSHPGTNACQGAACGVAERADNVRSMRQMAVPVSEYRLPPNTLTVSAPARVVEGDPGNPWHQPETFTVRLSTPAPAGGVQVDLSLVGGTATSGSDFDAFAPVRVSIAEGATWQTFQFNVRPDTVVEGDETFRIVLSNPVNATIHREALVTIDDDDPRAVVSGRFVLPEGMAPPANGFYVGVYESGTGGTWYPSLHWVSSPALEFRIPVQVGASVQVEVINPPGEYASFVEDLGVVQGSLSRDIRLKRARTVSGRLVFPAGQPVPTTPISMIAWGYTGGSSGGGGSANPPDFTYSFKVVDGAEVRLDAQNPPAPYVRQQRALGEVRSDIVADIQMGTVPSIVVPGVRIVEGEAGSQTTVRIPLYLSQAGPGTRVTVTMEEESAIGGRDFVLAAPKTIDFAAGNYATVELTVTGDGIPEADETIRLRLSDPQGAWLPSTTALVRLVDDDAGTRRSDVDGDGRGDILWRHRTNGLEAWHVDGGGVTTGVRAPMSADREILGTGDFNGDGRRDLVVWRAREDVEVWLYASRPAPQYLVHSLGVAGGFFIGAGDVDGDGRSDMLWHRSGSFGLVWWRMDGATVVGSLEQNAAAGQDVPLAVADFDGDRRADIVWADAHQRSLSLSLARASGYFEAAGIGAHPPAPWRVVGAGDVDGDGRADLLWHNRAAEQFDWWLMDGAARRGFGAQPIPARYSIAGHEDLDGDGRQDILWTDRGRREVWAWMGTGSAFAPRLVAAHPGVDWTTVASYPESMTAEPRPSDDPVRGDIDGSGTSDVLWHSVAHQQVDIWRAILAHPSSRAVSRSLPSAYRVALRGDFDANGLQDVVLHDTGRTTLWMWMRQWDGSHSVHYIGAHPPQGWSLVAARDVDGDSRDDLLWHNRALGQVDWWRMHGTLRIGVGSQSIPGKYQFIGAVDADGDARAELLWRDDAKTELWSWVPGGPGFAPKWIAAYPSPGWELAATGDVDGDRREDLVWHDAGAGAVHWWRMDGTFRTGMGSRAVAPRYRIIGSGRYAADDARIQLFWRDVERSELWLWTHDGGTFQGTEGVWGGHPGGDWEPVAYGP